MSSDPADLYSLVSEIAELLYPYYIDDERISYFAQYNFIWMGTHLTTGMILGKLYSVHF